MRATVTNRTSASRVAELLLAGLIFIGSLVLVAIPLGWLWLISRLDQPYLTTYLLALVGAPTMMIVWGIALARLNRLYVRVTGEREPAPVLEAGMTVAVLVAILMMAVWVVSGPGGGPMMGPWPG
jgi:hypothetical protein